MDSSADEISLEPREHACVVPLTPPQLAFWEGVIERGGLSSWRMCVTSVRIFGRLDGEAMREGVEAVVRRHESLRTRIIENEAGVQQLIDQACDGYFEVVSLQDLTAADAEREAHRLAQKFVGRQVDLSLDRLFEAKLFQLSDREHIFVMVLDHVLADAISTIMLSDEVWTTYRQAACGLPQSLPSLPVQFADYSVWRQQTYADWQRKHEPYWAKRVLDAPHVVLPIDQQSKTVTCESTASQYAIFDEHVSTKLRGIAWTERVPLSFILLTAYVAVMARWCNQRELGLFFITHGRDRSPKLRNMIGLVINHLYLRIEIMQDDSFVTLLRRIKLEFDAAYQHEDIDGLPQLASRCRTELCFNCLSSFRTFEWSPASLTLNAFPSWATSADTLIMKSFPLRVSWPLKFLPIFTDTAGVVAMTVAYRSDLFSATTIDHFFQNIQHHASEFARDPGSSIACVQYVC